MKTLSMRRPGRGNFGLGNLRVGEYVGGVSRTLTLLRKKSEATTVNPSVGKSQRGV